MLLQVSKIIIKFNLSKVHRKKNNNKYKDKLYFMIVKVVNYNCNAFNFSCNAFDPLELMIYS